MWKRALRQAIHDLSDRSQKPFVAINCGAIPAELLESQLFGHKKGSFTGAVADFKGKFQDADGGTLFLDEIGDTCRLICKLNYSEFSKKDQLIPSAPIS